MNTENLPLEELADEGHMYFRGFSVIISIVWVAVFATVLIVTLSMLDKPDWAMVHPQTISFIPAILLSNFFHSDWNHLRGNLILFVPLGFLVLNFEGFRGLVGIFWGMLIAGVAIWVFGEEGTRTIGFSGAVMACWGILLISLIRRDYRVVAIFLFLSYMFMEYSLFETLRPTASTEANNTSWLSHLGGVIGGMASQIRSLPVALELLYKDGKVTKEEFIAIATRISASTNVEDLTEPVDESGDDFQEEDKDTVNLESHSTDKKPDGKE